MISRNAQGSGHDLDCHLRTAVVLCARLYGRLVREDDRLRLCTRHLSRSHGRAGAALASNDLLHCRKEQNCG